MVRSFSVFSMLLVLAPAYAQDQVPKSVASLWADFDPKSDPLDSKVVRQWEEDGLVLRYVTYHIGTFKGKPARMAAFYGFPKGGKNLPALLHIHGGGQRAFLHEVKYYAARGYACLSVNWGGREMENAKPGEPNTDWGAVDPTQKNVPGYANLKPGEKYLDPFESPRNNNWYLLTLGCRRGLTLLEQQSEVDGERLGVYGHSMGGNLTVYVAGTDKRVKVAAPSVGGQGFRSVPWKLLPQQRRKVPNGDVDLYRSTLGFQSYAPLIKAPLLWLSATNDFHGIMDDTYRTGALIPHDDVQYSFAPHLNHRFTSEFAVTRPLWIDQHLKGLFTFPSVPKSQLSLEKIASFTVTPDSSHPIQRVHILYSVDPDPQARFWRTAIARREGGTWTADLPILSEKQPLFAFANVYYRLKRPEPVLFGRPTSTFAISSQLHTATPEELTQHHVQAMDKSSDMIEDFSRGFQDWYQLSADNPHHWQFWTRKISDPKWQGQRGDRLTLEVKTQSPNQLVLVIQENFFRNYRGRSRDFVAVVDLPGGDKWHNVTLAPSKFTMPDGSASLKSWDHADLLGLRAYYGDRQNPEFGSTRWAGPQPKLRNLRWTKTK